MKDHKNFANLRAMKTGQHEQLPSYRTLLRRIMAERQEKNPKFSLRAFAKFIGVEPSFLSLVLNGKRDFADHTFHQIVEKLNLSEKESSELLLLARIEKSKTASQRSHLINDLRILRPDLSSMRDLSVEQFKLISDWYHLPILILAELNDFPWSAKNISRTLGVPENEIHLALERLLALELIEVTAPNPRPKVVRDYLQVNSPEHNQALKRYHEEMLKKAIHSIQNDHPSTRVTTTANLALDEKQFQEVKELLEATQAKLLQICQKRKPKKEIYHISLNCFQLTQNHEKGKKA